MHKESKKGPLRPDSTSSDLLTFFRIISYSKKLSSHIIVQMIFRYIPRLYYQWIGLRENLNRKPSGFYHQI